MKNRFTRLTALACAAAILLCSLPMQALAAEFQPQTAYEDAQPDELPVQEEAPAAPEEPEASESAEQPEPAADAAAEPEAAPEEPAAAVLSSGNKSGDFTYSVLSDNTAQITGYSGTAANLVVPDKLDGYTVTRIGGSAFRGNSALSAVKLPDSVTYIDGSAFADCTNLESVNYPMSLNYVGQNAFINCNKITSFAVPEGVTNLPANMFWRMEGLRTVSLPTTLIDIGARAFYQCTGLTAIDLPKGLTKINDVAFAGCTGLTSIELPDSVTYIDGRAFADCTNLSSVNYPMSLNYVGQNAFINCNKITSFVVPEGVTNLPANMFWRMEGLRTVSLPTTLIDIGDRAFYQCTGLTAIDLPKGLTKINGSAFAGCTGLTSVELPDSVTRIDGGAFADCTNLSSVNYPMSLNYIGQNAFINCNKITSFVVPEGVTNLPADMFWRMSSLRTVSLPTTLIDIGARAFYQCTGLTAIDLPKGLIKINGSAFAGCTGLTSVELPDSVTRIDGGAFADCTNLSSVNYPMSLNYIGQNAFINCNKITSFVVPEGVTRLPANMFWRMEGLRTVSLPTTLTEIGDCAFYQCTGLSAIEFPEGLTKINGAAFKGCTALTSIVFPDSLTAIKGDAFRGCTALEGILLPRGLQTIEGHAFRDCVNLQSATVLSPFCNIANYAFSGCNSLTLYSSWASNVALYALENGIAFQPLDAANVDYSGYLSDMSATTLYSSASTASVSSRIPVTLKYSIPQAVFDSLKNPQIVFALSFCLEPMASAIAVNGKIADNVTRNDDVISIPISENSGVIQLSLTCVAAAQAGKAIVAASFSCTSEGKARKEILGVLVLNTPAIQLHEQSSISTATFDVSGICEKSKTLLLYIDDVQVGSVRAKKDGTFRTNVTFPNAPVSGTTYTLTAKREDDATITANIPIYYYEEAPNLTKFEMYYYAHSLKKLNLLNTDGTRLTNSIAPGHPFKFVVKFNHPEVLGRVCIASTKNGVTKKMDAVFNEETGEYIAQGYFKNTVPSYVPGAINVYYTIKSDTSIHSRDLKQAELPDLWRNATVDVMLDTGDTYRSQITLEDGQQIEFERNDNMTLEEVRAMLLPETSGQSRVQLNGAGVLDDPELEGVKSLVEDLKETYGKNAMSNAEKLWTSNDETVILVKDSIGKRFVFVFLDSADAAIRTAGVKFLGASFIQENSYGLSWQQSVQAYGFIADTGKNVFQFYNNMVDMDRAEIDIRSSTTLTEEQQAYALEKLYGVRWGYGAVSLLRMAGSVCNYAFASTGNPLVGVAVNLILSTAADLADNYLDDSMAYYAAGGRGSYLRWLIDPSGYVYDAETGERLAGVTVTAYWIEYDEEKGADESFWENTPANTTEGIKWDASEHSQQNSLITDESGCYAWEVPAGWWRVKYELAGYETAWSDWLPVPPPQLDVNIGLTPTAPEYTVRAETVTAEHVSVRVTSGSAAKQTARCVLAAYDTDGRLTATAVQTLSPGSTAELTLSGLSAGSTVKLFILNSTTGEPLRRSWSSALQAA